MKINIRHAYYVKDSFFSLSSDKCRTKIFVPGKLYISLMLGDGNGKPNRLQISKFLFVG